MCSADDLVMCLGDFNGHIGRHIVRFEEVHGEYGIGQRGSWRVWHRSKRFMESMA